MKWPRGFAGQGLFYLSHWPALQSFPRDMLCSRKLGCWLFLWVIVCQMCCINVHRGQWMKLLYLLEEVGSRSRQQVWELWKGKRRAFSCFFPPCVSRDKGRGGDETEQWGTGGEREQNTLKREGGTQTNTCAQQEEDTLLGNFVLLQQNIPHTVKGELIPAVTKIIDLQTTIVGKYLRYFMHFDFQILSMQ